MQLIHYCLLFVFLNSVCGVENNYFCNLTCNGNENTVCKYAPCKPSPVCGNQFHHVNLTNKQREIIVDYHNYYRTIVAVGSITNGSNGEATKMNVFSYDKELEFTAGCWAVQCEKSHDKCRKDSKGNAGQNLYTHFSTGHPERYYLDAIEEFIQIGIQAWFDENNLTNAEVLQRYYSSNIGWGHFTQLVWADTSMVGCALVQKSDDVYEKAFILACNYSPCGNIITRPVYVRGQLDCDGRNAKYSRLCGKRRYVEDDKWTSPFENSSSLNKYNYYLYIISFALIVSLRK